MKLPRTWMLIIVGFAIIIITVLLSQTSTCQSFEQMIHPRILNLVLFSHNTEYDEMYNITRQYYASQNIPTIYYTFSDNENQEQEYNLQNDILQIKGKDTFIPGILEKTIKTFEYIKPELNNYDYIVRTNISTIVNFNLLKKLLIQNPVEYGGRMLNIKGKDTLNGIVDETYLNLDFVAGTCIILSSNLMSRFLQKKHLLNYTLIDDVSISVLLKEQFNDVTAIGFTDYYYVSRNFNGNDQELINSFNPNYHIFYRNRCDENRAVDVRQMKVIVNELQNVNYGV